MSIYIYGSYTIGAWRGAQTKVGLIMHLRNGGNEQGSYTIYIVLIYVCVCMYANIRVNPRVAVRRAEGAGRGAQPEIGFIMHLRNGPPQNSLVKTEPDPCCHRQYLRSLRSQKTMSSRPILFAWGVSTGRIL